MKPPKRSRRRMDRARMVAKAKRVYPHQPAGKLADNLKICSCWMCGNPSRWGKGKDTKRDVEIRRALW